MMIIFLLFALIHGSDGSSCASGFTSLNNKCLKLMTSGQTYSAARLQCNQNGGNLVSIYNSIDNTAIAQFSAVSSDPIWIGLNCLNDLDRTSCLWDDQVGNTSTYNNFYGSNPSKNVGTCVYMLTSGSLRGRWFSGSCEGLDTSAMCETAPLDQCSYTLNGYCYYYPVGALTEVDAQNTCSQSCQGNLASIHSAEENALIFNMFKDTLKAYIRIGAQVSSQNLNSWIDGSAWNYTYIGYQNKALGSCYSMSVVNELVEPAKWISSNCSASVSSICKRPLNAQCTTTTTTAAPVQTLAPPQCSGVTYLTDEVIYSPNYPLTYLSITTAPCHYIFTVSTYTATVWFSELKLDAKSSIELYSSLETQTPFAIIDQNNPVNATFPTYQSPTSIIKLVFKPCSNCVKDPNGDVFKWKAILGTQYPTVCYKGNITTSTGFITNQGYHDNGYYSCSFPLQSSNKWSRLQLQFVTLALSISSSSSNIIKIYDGPDWSQPLLGTLFQNFTGNTNLTYTSTGQYLYVYYSGYTYVDLPGFTGVFYDYN